jgi:hypothetical protein
MLHTFTLRLTNDNIDTALEVGDVFADDPEFGAVRSARPVRDGSAAMVYNTGGGRDVFGLPQTVRIIRDCDAGYQLPGESEGEYFDRMETASDRAAWDMQDA